MKRTLFILICAFLCPMASQASSVLINIACGVDTSKMGGTSSATQGMQTGSFAVQTVDSGSWNEITATNSGATTNTDQSISLVDSSNQTSGLSISNINLPGSKGLGATFSSFPTGNADLSSKYDSYGNAWKGGVSVAQNGSTSSTQLFTLSGFQASTTYTITLLCGRANTYPAAGNNTCGFTLSGIEGLVDSVATVTAGGAPTPTTNGSTVSGIGVDANQMTEVTWTFTTGENVEELNVSLAGVGDYNVNMIEINSLNVPEPGTASLSLLGLGALVLRRKRSSVH